MNYNRFEDFKRRISEITSNYQNAVKTAEECVSEMSILLEAFRYETPELLFWMLAFQEDKILNS
jgi:hypothetical protein